MGLFGSIGNAIGGVINAVTGKSNYVKDITPSNSPSSSSTPATPAQTSYSFVPQSTINLAKAIEARGGQVPSQTLVTSNGNSYVTNSGGSSGGGTTTSTTIPAKTLAPIKSIDYVNAQGNSAGGITVQGTKQTGVKVLSSDFSQSKTSDILNSQGYTPQENLKGTTTNLSNGQAQNQTNVGTNQVSQNYLGNYNLGLIGLAGDFWGYLSSNKNKQFNESNSNIMGTDNSLLAYSPTLYLANKINPQEISSLPGKAWNWLGKNTPEISIPIFSGMGAGAGGSIPLSELTKTSGEYAQTLPEGQLNKQIEDFNKKWAPYTSGGSNVAGSLKGNYARELPQFTGTQEQYQTYSSEFQNIEALKQTAKSDWAGGAEYYVASGISKLPTTYEKWGIITGAVWAGTEVLGGLYATTAGKAVINTATAGYSIYTGTQMLNPNLMPSQRIGAGINTGLGALSLSLEAYRGVSNLAGYPKSSTRVIGVSQNIENNKVLTDVYFITDIKTSLLGRKTVFGRSTGTGYINDLGEIQAGKTYTQGVYSQGAYDLMKGKYVAVGKPVPFVSGSIDFSKTADITVTNLKITPQDFGTSIEIGKSTPAKMSAQFDFGAVVSPKSKSYFAGVGGNFGTNDLRYVFGETGIVKNGKLLKQGQGFYQGFIKNRAIPTDLPDSSIVAVGGRGSKSSSEFINSLYYPQEVNRVINPASSIITQTAKTKTVKVSTEMFPLVSATDLIEKNYPSYVGGSQTQSELLSKDYLTRNNQDFLMKSNTVLIINSPQKNRFAQDLFQPSAQFPNQDQINFQTQVPGQVQISKQEQRQSQAQRVGTAIPINPILDMPNPRISLPNFNFGFSDKQLGNRKIGFKRIVKYVPSYSALVFNIRGRAPKGTETGLRLRPITQGFSFANLFSKRVIKVRRRRK